MVRFALAFLVAASLTAEQFHYIMPREGVRAEKMVVNKIGSAKKEIVIAMYSFTNATIAKSLKDAAGRGVVITLVADDRQNSSDTHSKVGELAKIQNITVLLAKGDRAKNGDYNGIMHLKVAVIDGKHSIYGSANWSASAFNINHEILFFDDNAALAQELREELQPLISSATEY